MTGFALFSISSCKTVPTKWSDFYSDCSSNEATNTDVGWIHELGSNWKKTCQLRFHKAAAGTQFPSSWYWYQTAESFLPNKLIVWQALLPFLQKFKYGKDNRKRSVNVPHSQSLPNALAVSLSKKYQNFKPNGSELNPRSEWNTLSR